MPVLKKKTSKPKKSVKKVVAKVKTLRVVSIRLTPAQFKKLSSYCKKKGITKSDLIRDFIDGLK